VRRHVSADEMASYAAGDLRPGKAARITAHLDDCPACRQLVTDLEGVSALLASVSMSFERMPANLSARIEAAFVTEAAHRAASEPAGEASRRDLPTRRARSWRLTWRLPRITSGALRTVAATAAAVVVAGGIYELASQGAGSSAPGRPSASGVHASEGPLIRAAAPAMARPSYGPEVTLMSAGRVVSLRTASASTDFAPQHMQAQVDSAVTQATDDGLIASNKRMLSLPTNSALRDFNYAQETSTAQRLAGCIERVAGNRIPELVELARFNGKPATVIVLPAVTSYPAEVLVVSAFCSAQASDLLDHQELKHV
jgi:Putative zinc-finger